MHPSPRRRYAKVPLGLLSALPSHVSRSAPAAESLLVRLLLSPTRRAVPGLLRMGVGALAEELEWSPRATRRVLGELANAGIVAADDANRVLFVRGAITADPPFNENALRAFAADIAELPDASPIVREVCDEVSAALKGEKAESLREFWQSLVNKRLVKPPDERVVSSDVSSAVRSHACAPARPVPIPVPVPVPVTKDQKAESIARHRASTLTLTADRRRTLTTETADDGNHAVLTQLVLHLIEAGIIERNGDEDAAVDVVAREARARGIDVEGLRSPDALHGIVALARLRYRNGLRPDASPARQPAELVPVADLAASGAGTSPACEPGAQGADLRKAATS